MNTAATNHDPSSEKHSPPVTGEPGTRLSSVLLNRASLAAARQSERPWGATLLWLLLGAGGVLWPLTQTYQQTSTFVAGSGLEWLACRAICNEAEAPPCALTDTGTAICRGQATIESADEAARPGHTATIRSTRHLFSTVAWGTAALSETFLR